MKIECHAALYRNRTHSTADKPVSTHASARRYSWMQAATVGALHDLANEAPALFDKIFADGIPFLYASAVGDVTAHATIAAQICDNSFPVSPLAFQNSVLNAAVASFLIEKKQHNPHYALSHCDASFDVMALQAAQMIESGEHDGAVLAFATESAHSASCEVILFGTPKFLRDCARKYAVSIEWQEHLNTETCSKVIAPRLDLDGTKSFERIAPVANDCGITSSWRPL